MASAAQRLANSSLYLVAALLVYLALWSLLASAAEPPCDWKYLVALSLPPIFMMRSWSHCHTALNQHAVLVHTSPTRPRIARTVEVGRSHKGNVYAHVTVVRRAVEAQIDAKRHRAPCWVLCAAVETYLHAHVYQHPQRALPGRGPPFTLFAGFAFSFANIFCDCVLVASAMIG